MSGQTRRLLVIEGGRELAVDYTRVFDGSQPPADAGGDVVEANYDIEIVREPQAALDEVLRADRERRPFAVMIVEMGPPPGWDELSTLPHIWAETPGLEVLLLCPSKGHNYAEVRASLGNSDQLLFVSTPHDESHLRELVSSLARKHELESGMKLRNAQLMAMSAALQSETDRRQLMADQQAYGASHDPLTGLLLRGEFAQRLEHQRPAANFHIAQIRLDRFDAVTLGLSMEAIDGAIDSVACDLQSALIPGELLARGEGPTFWIAYPVVEGDKQLRCELLRNVASRPIASSGASFELSASAGYREVGPESSIVDALRDAHNASTLAAQAGGGTTLCYDEGMQQSTRERLEIAGALARAVREEAFELHYQPIVNLTTGHIAGFEALLRWTHPELGDVPPEEFVPLARTHGLIADIGAWVLKTALCQLRSIHQAGHEELTMSINLSPVELDQAGLPEAIAAALRDTGQSAQHLRLEISETAMATDPRHLLEVLSKIRDSGVAVHLDDFGTGQISLQQLELLPVDGLKIDHGFIRELDSKPRTRALVEMMHRLAEVIGVPSIAEGIESGTVASALRSLGCEFGQGFHFSVPLPGDKVMQLLASGADFSHKFEAANSSDSPTDSQRGVA